MNDRGYRMPALALLLLLLGGGVAGADEAPMLDGRLDDAAWAEAQVLEVGALADVAGTARVLVLPRAGELWIGVEVPEPPGPGMGFSAMIAPEGIERAADAVSLAYAPQDPRSPAYVARGTRGVGRAHYRMRAAAHVTGRTTWSVEAAVPLAVNGLKVDVRNQTMSNTEITQQIPGERP